MFTRGSVWKGACWQVMGGRGAPQGPTGRPLSPRLLTVNMEEAFRALGAPGPQATPRRRALTIPRKQSNCHVHSEVSSSRLSSSGEGYSSPAQIRPGPVCWALRQAAPRPTHSAQLAALPRGHLLCPETRRARDTFPPKRSKHAGVTRVDPTTGCELAEAARRPSPTFLHLRRPPRRLVRPTFTRWSCHLSSPPTC